MWLINAQILIFKTIPIIAEDRRRIKANDPVFNSKFVYAVSQIISHYSLIASTENNI